MISFVLAALALAFVAAGLALTLLELVKDLRKGPLEMTRITAAERAVLDKLIAELADAEHHFLETSTAPPSAAASMRVARDVVRGIRDAGRWVHR